MQGTKFVVYTDGGCQVNPGGAGGLGVVILNSETGQRQEISEGYVSSTNNRMEMTALLEAFRALKKDGQTIEVFSDSAYLMDCFRKKWYVNWLKNGWKNAKKQPVENRDLWEQLLPYLESHTISFYRVKGHINTASPSTNMDAHYEKFLEWNGAGFTYDDFLHIVDMNNRCDALANKGVDSLR